MPDRKKIINGLECCTDGFMMCKRERCPYYGKAPIDSTCRIELEKDALALLKEQEEEIENLKQTAQSMMEGICLLKEQEAKQVIGIADSIEGMEVGYCPSCGRAITNKKIDETKFCKFCGRAVKWDDT